MASLPDIVLDILAEPRSVKIVGTVKNHGMPNLVVISTVAVIDPETIAFGDICLGKTKENLLLTGKFTLTVIGSEKKAYQIWCRFVHFENETPRYRIWYAAIWQKMMMHLKGIAIAKVEKVCSVKQL